MAEKATQTAKVPAAPAPSAGRTMASRLRGSPLFAIERELDALFEDFRRRLRWPTLFAESPIARGEPSIAAFDVYEHGDEVVVKAELPGMTKDDIEISVSDSTLTLKGEKRRQEEKKEEDYTYSERSFGMVSRTVELPAEVKADQAKASLKDGVLEIHIPKTDAAKHRHVKVAVQ